AVDARVDAVVWPLDGMLPRPSGFAAIGDLSSPGPLRLIVRVVCGGVVLILAGAAYGPVAERAARSRRARTGATGVR
ncbi:signal peptidase I, partial [Streptomyces sp. TRM76130]|nr:signal peptidase I [Streptomyces sp. TRM76130]